MLIIHSKIDYLLRRAIHLVIGHLDSKRCPFSSKYLGRISEITCKRPYQNTKVKVVWQQKAGNSNTFSLLVPYQPTQVRRAGALHYYTGDCTTPEAKSQIQHQFIEILNTSAVNMICNDAVYRDKCKAENVRVTCSLVETDVSRKRRETGNRFCVVFPGGEGYSLTLRIGVSREGS